MPLYEYTCKSCAHPFEVLLRSGETPACPACRGTLLERRLSVFATSTGGSPRDAMPGPCGSCGDPRGPGACSMN